jgi:oligopeptide transport system ATP-binding protein
MSALSSPPNPLLRVRDLKKHFPVGQGWLSSSREFVRAVNGISFEIAPAETLGLVGESGCGKTTTGRVILGLEQATAGEVHVGDSPNLAALSQRNWFPYRRRVQMIFQDPFSSLNPRMAVGAIIGEALSVHNLAHESAKRKRVEELLDQVGLSPDAYYHFPHEFSGGQRQRIGIARALAVEPELIIADEPVSALDVSIQAQIINLLRRLQQERGLSFLFISHDLSVVGHISHRVAVMYMGQIVEMGSRDDIFNSPRHPYTITLLSAVPKLGTKDSASTISPPVILTSLPDCGNGEPHMHEVSDGHWVACR